MSKIQKLVRTFIATVLALGFMVSAVSVASARDVDVSNAQIIGRDTFAGNDDLVQQLVQILIDILNDLLNSDDDLADVLPPACSVEDGGFSCDTSSGEASLFLGTHCEPSIFADDVYLCTVASAIYSCNLYGPTTVLICVAP